MTHREGGGDILRLEGGGNKKGIREKGVKSDGRETRVETKTKYANNSKKTFQIDFGKC